VLAAPLLLVLLAACVPAVPGATVTQALRITPGVPLTVGVGSSFVEIRFSYADFGYAPGDPDLRAFRFQGVAAQPPSNDVGNAFALQDVVAPAGWRLTLERATARRTPLGGRGMAAAPDGVEYRLDMVFDLIVSTDAAPGRYLLSGVLNSRSADDIPFSFDVEVR
jgi:hypothetical protein